MTIDESVVRQQILQRLRGEGAHLSFDDAVAAFPLDRTNEEPLNVPYTPWHLLEHLRRSQEDILKFMLEADYESPAWPQGYWPARDEHADAAGWQASIDGFQTDLARVIGLVEDPDLELSAEIPHAPGYTYVREFMLIIDHNAYHIGEFAILRQVMGAWPAGRQA